MDIYGYSWSSELKKTGQEYCFYASDKNEIDTFPLHLHEKYSIQKVIRDATQQALEILNAIGTRSNFVDFRVSKNLNNLLTKKNRHDGDSKTDYTIILGEQMLQGLDHSGLLLDTLPSLLGHELGHCFEFEYMHKEIIETLQGAPKSILIRDFEIMADHLGGQYTAYLHRNGLGAGLSKLYPKLQAFLRISTYDFNKPTFHGTASRRFHALRLGYESSFNNEKAIPFDIENAKAYISTFVYSS
ncbi:MAG: hypothetical protein AB2799_22690 [Candidatus Thiodiazotropha sp.]